MVRLLIKSNADVSARDNDGWTPLHFATQNHSVDIAQLLLGAGASVDAEDVHGNTPLWRAVFESRGRGEIIGLLLRAGADKHRKLIWPTGFRTSTSSSGWLDEKQGRAKILHSLIGFDPKP